jgi:hypothetical protein
MHKKTVRDLADEQLRGKRALVRVDFNVPLDADRRVGDDTRIRAALPTLRALVDRGARVVLLSHLGRPKGAPDPKYSLQPVADRLAELMPGTDVDFCETTDTDDAVTATERLGEGEVLVLENTRFLGGEEANDERLARDLAKLGDLYVNDAFGAAHRAHASTEGVAHHLRPAVAGLLMEKELAYLGRALAEPQRPFVAVLGGAKISGKMDVIEQLVPRSTTCWSAAPWPAPSSAPWASRPASRWSRPTASTWRAASSTAPATSWCSRPTPSSHPRSPRTPRRRRSAARRSRPTRPCSTSGPRRWSATRSSCARPDRALERPDGRVRDAALRRRHARRRAGLAEATAAGRRPSWAAATRPRRSRRPARAPGHARLHGRRRLARVPRRQGLPGVAALDDA